MPEIVTLAGQALREGFDEKRLALKILFAGKRRKPEVLRLPAFLLARSPYMIRCLDKSERYNLKPFLLPNY